jgi:hypothetical protein
VRLKKLCILIPLVMLPLGSWLGYRTFHDRPFADIAESVAAIPSAKLALAFASAAVSYLCFFLSGGGVGRVAAS